MAKDHSHKPAVEPTGGGTLEVVDVERKPSYPVAPLEPKHVEPHSFDSMTQVVTYLRDKLRDTPLVSPEESAAEVFKMLNRDLTQTERDALFKLLLVKEAHQAGLFPKKPIDMNALSDKLREGAYPYKNRYPNKLYEKELYDLQVELLKLQDWVKRTNSKIIVLFEGRDAAGKGGTIRRFTENLNPRGARTVALSKPTENEAGQWYFQRYCAHLPNPGEICFFDRSWYNRAVVEPVILHARADRNLPQRSDGLLAVPYQGRHAHHQVLARREPGRTAPPLPRTPREPVEALEALSRRHRVHGPLGRLFEGHSPHVPDDRHGRNALDGDPQRRQTPRSSQRHPRAAAIDSVRQPRHEEGGQHRPAHRRSRRQPLRL